MEILDHLIFSGLVVKWQKPNVIKCAEGRRYGIKPNVSYDAWGLESTHFSF
jgi:hypothetical protein